MKPETRLARELEIEEAAYDLLSEKGYGGMSMLSVAKRARCSNETLYNWYGDKLGLLRSMVSRNAEKAKQILREAEAGDEPHMEVLGRFGPALLSVLLSEKAIALNRAAATDATHELGATLAEAGRETVLPMIEALIARAFSEGHLHAGDVAEAVDLYLRLLVGDLQIRRVIGRMPPLSREAIDARSESALTGLKRLMS